MKKLNCHFLENADVFVSLYLADDDASDRDCDDDDDDKANKPNFNLDDSSLTSKHITHHSKSE